MSQDVHSPSRRMRSSGALWLVGIGLLANAAVMLLRGHAPDLVFDSTAFGQATPAPGGQLGARGIYMTPAQLGPNAFGLFLMDVDSGTICVYRMTEANHFRFVASRSYKNDRFLEDYNNEGLSPKETQALVEQQRKRVELQQKDNQPTVEQTPKPDENAPDSPK